jgi:antimicrobial peptide system SdpA family protein
VFKLEGAARRTTTGPRLIVALSALWAVVAVYSVHAVLPTNVLELPFRRSVAEPVHAVLPQGWAFFTKSPRDPILTAYEFDEQGRPRRVPEISSPDHRNLFGINRRGRAIGTELAHLLDAVPPERWIACEPAGDQCVSRARAGSPYRVVSPVPGPRLCGEVVFAVESVVPYAYRNLVEDRLVVDQAAYLDIDCGVGHEP